MKIQELGALNALHDLRPRLAEAITEYEQVLRQSCEIEIASARMLLRSLDASIEGALGVPGEMHVLSRTLEVREQLTVVSDRLSAARRLLITRLGTLDVARGRAPGTLE
jgi:hypothetical protein